jgi:Saxitoxin biosynthesis operon protein SxtJ
MATILEPECPRSVTREGSDRSFGLVFAAAFAVLGCWPLVHGRAPRWWALGLALAFALTAAVRPALLHQANRGWLAFGRAMHRVVSPLVMGAVFFLCITPIAWIMRLAKKDVLSLGRRNDLASYWIPRVAPPPAAETMKRQF